MQNQICCPTSSKNQLEVIATRKYNFVFVKAQICGCFFVKLFSAQSSDMSLTY